MSCVPVFLCVLLSVFVATGNALLCVTCSSFNDSVCTGNSQSCSTGVCGSTKIRNAGPYWHSSIFLRSCLNVTECDKQGTLSNQYMKTTSSSTCCDTDSCTPSTPSLPIENNIENGLTCPSYIDPIIEPCSITSRTRCTGDQIRCMRYSTSTTLGSSNSKLFIGGCASESLCDRTSSYISAPGVTLDVNKLCTNNSNRLYHSLSVLSLPILLVLSCLFLHPYPSM
ncbi:phospholipase A2 inhibitor and Ly6/PLAUR domain-containing protein-like [Ascaphus truei]|uniref:phospholipase A2 inhibitor and Ly6/PLAUR domain-containing protein-like n=1 Tax=Ascaphus truei TaxID=8439 RepID=UPI003F5A6787